MKDQNPNIWLTGMMGIVVGDALGNPVQFYSREEIAEEPVTDMEAGGVYNTPIGTWTDDSSMALATLDSIRELREIDLEDIMTRFIDWYEDGEYTPFGNAFDIGNTCSYAIEEYEKNHDVYSCGRTNGSSNGNGSLMRILPACLYAYACKMTDADAIKMIHEVSGLTHNHIRSKMACGLYYFCIKAVLENDGILKDRLQNGLNSGFAFYEKDVLNSVELSYYGRLRDLAEFTDVPEKDIKSGGYVVESIEAAIWCLITTNSFKEALLKVVNLGDDSDSIGAIAGGLATLYYGYESIPEEWISVIQRREWIETMCNQTQDAFVG